MNTYPKTKKDLNALFKQRLSETKSVLAATSCEMQMLWEKFSTESMHKVPGFNIYHFEQLNPGNRRTIGHLDNRPVNLDLCWWKINGVMIMQYEAVSQVVDHIMIGKWLTKNCNHCRWTRYNADNFHNLLHFVNQHQTNH